jgi:hypothetical protein
MFFSSTTHSLKSAASVLWTDHALTAVDWQWYSGTLLWSEGLAQQQRQQRKDKLLVLPFLTVIVEDAIARTTHSLKLPAQRN